MTQKEVERFLRHNAFVMVRTGGKTHTWSDGHTTIHTSKSSEINGHYEKDIKKQVALAIEKREKLMAHMVRVPPGDDVKRIAAKMLAHGVVTGIDKALADSKAVKIQLERENEEAKAKAAEEKRLAKQAEKERAFTAKLADVAKLSEKKEIPVLAKVEEPVTSTKPKIFKFSGETKQRTWGRLAELSREGWEYREIGQLMRDEGYKMPDGVEPITDHYVRTTIIHMRGHGYQVDPPASRPVVETAKVDGIPASKPPTLEVLPAIETPKPTTIVIKRPVEVTAAPSSKLPMVVVAIIQDTSLTADQKVNMIAAYGGIKL